MLLCYFCVLKLPDWMFKLWLLLYIICCMRLSIGLLKIKAKNIHICSTIAGLHNRELFTSEQFLISVQQFFLSTRLIVLSTVVQIDVEPHCRCKPVCLTRPPLHNCRYPVIKQVQGKLLSNCRSYLFSEQNIEMFRYVISCG